MDIIGNYGYKGNLDHDVVARIIAVHKGRFEMMTNFGQTDATLKSSVYYGKQREVFPTVGDFVTFFYNVSGDSLITTTLERSTYLERLDPSSKGKSAQGIAANVDNVFIMTSANFDFNVNRIERYLAVSYESGAKPIILITKADLAPDLNDYLRQLAKFDGKVEIIPVSVVNGQGVAQVKSIMQPRTTSVFLGSSGVGKSSLVNCIAGAQIMDVNGIREDDSRGRHTTTYRQMIALLDGALIIDTPGMREVGIWSAEKGVSITYEDIEELKTQCKFSNCSHTVEKGCAVLQAIKDGSLSEEEWKNYKKLTKEVVRIKKKETYNKKIYPKG